MKKILKKISCLLCCVMMVGALAGCKEFGNENGEKGYLYMANSPSTTLDNVWYNTGGIFRCAVFESLLSVDADMSKINCALAEKYTVSEDGLKYTFTLKKNVKWHDGKKFDTEDVLFSMKTALRSDEINGLFTSAFGYIKGANEYAEQKTDDISGITVEGEKITFELTHTIGNFLDAIAQFAILPEHLLGEIKPNELSSHDYWKKPIGCGPYRVAEAVENEYFMLEAYGDYYGDKPGVKKIKIKMNDTSSVEAMKKGELDFYVTNDPEEISVLKGIDNCSEHRLNILFPAYLIINMSSDEGVNEQLQDVKVRKALLLAIDRKTIVDNVFPGSTVTDTMIPSWDNLYYNDGESYAYDAEAAKKLLEEAEFDFSVPIRLRYSAKGQSTIDLMNAIAVYWRAIGIKVDLEKFEGSGSKHMFEIRDFDICYKRLSAFEHATIYEEIHGEGVMQQSILNRPVYDEMINKLTITMDEKEREQIIKDMQKLDQQHLLRIPLFALANVAYVNDSHFKMPDAYGNLWYRYDLRFDEWKLVN